MIEKKLLLCIMQALKLELISKVNPTEMPPSFEWPACVCAGRNGLCTRNLTSPGLPGNGYKMPAYCWHVSYNGDIMCWIFMGLPASAKEDARSLSGF